MYTRCRTDIHNVVRCTHRIFIMLHDDQRISQILEVHQCPKQLIVIPLVQTDTRFIQNIGNANKSRTDLGCKADSLCLASGKCSGRTRQRQIFQPHFLQEPDTRTDLF